MFTTLNTSAQDWANQLKVVASDRAYTNNFGASVSISGDYAIIGSPGDDEPIPNTVLLAAGSICFFKKDSNDIWGELQKVTSTDISAEDLFGQSVSIDGNYAIVGVNYEDEDVNGANFMNRSGSAYIFERGSNDCWNQVQKIVASDRSSYNYFGNSVSINGNYAFIGAEYSGLDTSSIPHVGQFGKVYIYKRDSSGTWQEVQILIASDRSTGDRFGSSVEVNGAYSIIGAKEDKEDASGANPRYRSGSAYIFKRDSNGIWTEDVKLVAFDRDTYDYFGQSVSIRDNLAIVGAGSKDFIAPNDTIKFAGAAYLYENNINGSWSYVQKIVANDKVSASHFGLSVSISNRHAVVGAPYDRYNSFGVDSIWSSGSAYIFLRDSINGYWSLNKKITSNDRDKDDEFGFSVSIDNKDILIGAIFDDEDLSGQNYISDAGAAYFFNSLNVGIIENYSELGIIAYPNPTNGEIKIELEKMYDEISVCIYNIQGQLIMSKKYKSINSMNLEINEAPGLYFIQFKYRNGLSSILKVIIE